METCSIVMKHPLGWAGRYGPVKTYAYFCNQENIPKMMTYEFVGPPEDLYARVFFKYGEYYRASDFADSSYTQVNPFSAHADRILGDLKKRAWVRREAALLARRR